MVFWLWPQESACNKQVSTLVEYRIWSGDWVINRQHSAEDSKGFWGEFPYATFLLVFRIVINHKEQGTARAIDWFSITLALIWFLHQQLNCRHFVPKWRQEWETRKIQIKNLKSLDENWLGNAISHKIPRTGVNGTTTPTKFAKMAKILEIHVSQILGGTL